MLLKEILTICQGKSEVEYKKNDEVLYWDKGDKKLPIECKFDSLDNNKDYCYVKLNSGKLTRVECCKLTPSKLNKITSLKGAPSRIGGDYFSGKIKDFSGKIKESKESITLHGVKMNNHCMVAGADYFGMQSENPDAYKELAAVFKIFGITAGVTDTSGVHDKLSIEKDTLWAYDEDGFSKEYDKLAKALKINDDSDLSDQGFVKAKTVGDTELWYNKKAKAITTVQTGDFVPAMIFVAK